MPRFARVEARPVGVLGVDLRQRDVRPAVVGPGLQLRQLVDRRLAGQHRARADLPRPGVPGVPRGVEIQPRPPQEIGRIDLQARPAVPARRACRGTGIASAPSCRTGCRPSETGSPRTLRKQHRRPARAKHPPLNLRHLQLRIDRHVDPHELPGGLQVVDALSKSLVGHGLPCVVSRPHQSKPLSGCPILPEMEPAWPYPRLSWTCFGRRIRPGSGTLASSRAI